MGQSESSFTLRRQRTQPIINENDAFKLKVNTDKDQEAIQVSEIQQDKVKTIALGRSKIKQLTRAGTKLNILQNIDMYDNQRQSLVAPNRVENVTPRAFENNANVQQAEYMTKLFERSLSSQRTLKQKTNQSINSEGDEVQKVKGPNIFQKAINRASKTSSQQFSGDFQNTNGEKQKTSETLSKVDMDTIQVTRQKELQKIIEKYEFINHWYRGPDPQQKIEKIFVKGEKVLIIEDDEPIKKDAKNQLDDEVLGELLQQKIAPTTFILGDKMKILENLKAQEEKVNKEKKEQETKQLIKKSDVRMVIYPAYNNFFVTSNNHNQ